MTQIVIVMAIVCGIAGFRIGTYKGHPIAGLILGLLLGLIGVGIIAIVPQTGAARVERAERRMRAEQEAARRLRGAA